MRMKELLHMNRCQNIRIALHFFFDYTDWGMQGEQIPVVGPTVASQDNEEDQIPLFDFSECSRIKKLTTHEYQFELCSIYRFKHQNMPLVVKLFAPEALANY